jgi:hypothetical protein
MHRFVVRIALRQHVSLRAGAENPQHRFKHLARRNWFAPGAAVGNIGVSAGVRLPCGWAAGEVGLIGCVAVKARVITGGHLAMRKICSENRNHCPAVRHSVIPNDDS